jgi:hypothetical protein
VGWAISDQPSAATVLAALGAAIRIDTERGPFAESPAACAVTVASSSPPRCSPRRARCWRSAAPPSRRTART